MKLRAAAHIINQHVNNDNIARSPVTIHQMQYKARGLELYNMDEETRARSTLAMQEIISLANGLDDGDVEIHLRQGSRIIDAKASMPTSVGEPVTPTT